MARTASPKVLTLLAEARVMPVGVASVYEVAGDHGTYRVIVGDGWTQCPCPANREACSHAIAAGHLHDAIVDAPSIAAA